MKNAKIDSNEQDRLSLLKEYSILDTLPEEDYDNLSKLAAQICGTPISLISLLDDKRQWFKSNHGIEETQTPIEQAFCAHAISRNNTYFSVNDARIDDRFSDNPLVTGHPSIVFYGGMPLRGPSGIPIGTLCVIDNKPRTLTEEQQDALKILSEQVMNLLELRKNKQALELANEKLKLFSAEQEKKIRERTKELEFKTRKLELTNIELASFNRICSHDLQEPLRKIQMFISQINITELDNLSEKGRRKFERVKVSADRMRDIVHDLFTYGATESERNEIVSVLLSELVNETKDLLGEKISKGNATLKVVKDGEINVIPLQFKQMLFNLFSNSIKFMRAQTSVNIEISVNVIESSQSKVRLPEKYRRYTCISISDNGIGFDQKYEDKIFEVFQCLHNKNEYQGTGIGLSIVKRVVLNHNGIIKVNSVRDKGTRFDVYLPIQENKDVLYT